jgi:hypothetical protein
MLIGVYLLVLLLAGFLFWRQGAWSNILNFFNMVFAGLTATTFFEPAASAIEKQGMHTNRFMTDIVLWWVLFAVIYVLMRLTVDALSRHRVEYQVIAEKAICGIMSLGNAFLLVCFISMSTHLAPLNPAPFQGTDLSSPQFLGMSPDRMWLGFVAHQSTTIMSGSNTFNSDGFISAHAARRAELENLGTYRPSFVDPKQSEESDDDAAE